MCTAVSYKNRLFGRTFDYHKSFGEGILITPREKVNFGEAKNRYSMIGMGILVDDMPLYYDGMNEFGLFCAALNFSGFAHYDNLEGKKTGISSSHLVGFLLGFCKSVDEVKGAMDNIAITSERPAEEMKAAQLHWMVCDGRGCAVIEPTKGGVRVRDNPFGVLTNAPDFAFHSIRMADFASLSPRDGQDNMTDGMAPPYSHGMGAIGLPGDYSSTSRFVKAAFVRKNIRPILDFNPHMAVSRKNEICEVNDFFDLMKSVSVPYGCSFGEDNMPMLTLYTVCADPEELNYYFTDYTGKTICLARLREIHFTAKKIISIPIYRSDEIKMVN